MGKSWNIVIDCQQSTTQTSACQECSCLSCDDCVSSARIRVGFLFGHVEATGSEYNPSARVCVIERSSLECTSCRHGRIYELIFKHDACRQVVPERAKGCSYRKCITAKQYMLTIVVRHTNSPAFRQSSRAMMEGPWDRSVSASYIGKTSSRSMCCMVIA